MADLSRDSPERKRRKPEPRLSVIRLSLKTGILDPELLRHTQNLAHQVKADPRKKPGGLAKELEKLYPFASLHTEGAEGPQDDLLGTVRIDTEPSDPKGQEGHKAASVTIFSLYGQRYGGPPGKRADSSADREAYFKKALADIQRKAPDLKSIAFPENIGCGIGAGNWPNYEEMIIDFASDMPGCTVHIVHYGA